MKSITKLSYLMTFLLIGLYSCDMNNTDSLLKKNGKNSIEDDPSWNSRKADKNALLGEGACESLQDGILVSWNDADRDWTGDENGSFTVCRDGSTLFFEFCVSEEMYDLGWRIQRTYFFIGTQDEWPFVPPDYPEGHMPTEGEIAYSDDFSMYNHYPRMACGTREVEVADWMFEDCFIWAAKVRIINLNSESPDYNKKMNHLAFLSDGSLTWEDENTNCFGRPGTGTPGYWKNKPWPVDGVYIGGMDEEDFIPRAEAVEYMKHPTAGDKTYNMFEQLVAAKLNVIIGNDDSCISEYIEEADNWMAMYHVGDNVDASSDAWQEPIEGNDHSASEIHYMLDQYNNGFLGCADHRD